MTVTALEAKTRSDDGSERHTENSDDGSDDGSDRQTENTDGSEHQN